MMSSKIFSFILILDAMPFLQMVMVVTVSVLLAACLIMLAMHFLRQSNLESLEGFGYIGNDLVAGVFGLLLAFLIISMYESNKNAAESADKEDNDLVSIFLNSQKLDNASLIRKEVQTYTETLLSKQWPAMVLGDLTTA